MMFSLIASVLLALTAQAMIIPTPKAEPMDNSISGAIPDPLSSSRATLWTGGSAVRVQYNTEYDNGGESINRFACSNGPNGLGTKGYHNLGEVHNFPMVGAAPTVHGWDSPECGACYAITYDRMTIYVTAVDAASNAFVLSEQAMNRLTNNRAREIGSITAEYRIANARDCDSASYST